MVYVVLCVAECNANCSTPRKTTGLVYNFYRKHASIIHVNVVYCKGILKFELKSNEDESLVIAVV